MASPPGLRKWIGFLTVAGLLGACDHHPGGPALEQVDELDGAAPQVAPPAETGPRLGALANVTPVYDRPSRRGAELGYLHAGATVARAASPYSTRGCDGGWFPIHPSGFVCAGTTATTDLSHPTLSAMATQPARDAPLPYTYARTVRDTSLFELGGAGDDAVRPLSPLRARTGLAIVGSWSAKDPEGRPMRLAMTTEGRFVPADTLESIEASPFHGVDLREGKHLPVAFVVKRGVRAWTLRGEVAEKGDLLRHHEELDLTGKTRTVDGVEFLAAEGDRWVRARDVTVILARHDHPPFATDGQKWLDVSVVTGALVAYVGKTPVFATLVSVGQDRLDTTAGAAVTRRGQFEVVQKSVTLAGTDPDRLGGGVPAYDVPWALELSSGQFVVGAYWHDRFGVEHGPGNLELSPLDARWVFAFADPPLPPGWHGVKRRSGEGPATLVNVR